MSLADTTHQDYVVPMEKYSPKLRSSVPPWPQTAATKFHHGVLTDRIIACAISVHKELGPGFLESVYEEAFSLELNHQKIPHQRQLPVRINYRGCMIGTHRIDLLIDHK